MKIKEGLRKKWRTVLIITLCWVMFLSISFISQYFFVYDLIALKTLSGTYPFWEEFIGTVVFGTLVGLAGGCLLVFNLGSRYREKSFAFGIVNAGVMFILTYVGLIVFGLFTINLIFHSFQENLSYGFSKAVNTVLFNILTPSFIVNVIVFGVIVSCTQFMLQVSDKFGPGILWKFLTGKYYNPRQEERIFMFLDLRSSTSIAEKLSSQKFFDLLKDVFQDITEPILNSQGEIYQYVGDEVVLSWPVDRGLAENNCLSCFFRIEQALKKRSEHYQSKYDVFPSFKAGLHIGEATVGEIGVIKKDIVYSGDVLNTASRIQGECNNQKVNILLSSDLIERMHLNGAYELIALGEFPLKGKKERTTLYAIKER